MRKIALNDGWQYKNTNDRNWQSISLPHDAMITEVRNGDSQGGANISWFHGGQYIYQKELIIEESYLGNNMIIEFEGVYRNAEVYLDGVKIASRPYGYTNFYVDLTPHIQEARMYNLTVYANNHEQPNSRWYSGSGIYRPVHLWLLPEKHILLNGIKIKTLGINPPQIEVAIKTNQEGPISIRIMDQNQVIGHYEGQATGDFKCTIDLPKAKLWSTESPNLYECHVTFGEDHAKERFGIRQLQWDSQRGMTLNQERIIIKGACVHHDNGLLGACAYEEAERRKVKLHQSVGYNAIRSAHNPCSKAMLDACDELGMLVMDEYLDVWYIHKTQYDYVDYFEQWWQQDLKDMVDKDYNHPSVILYSTGNEVSETAQERGITLTGEMTQYLHQLDETRPVTCGINIFFNLLSSLGFGVYSDEKAQKESHQLSAEDDKAKKKPVGSEFYNTLAGLLGDKTMKMGATLHGCDVKTRDAFANMDIAGYNYGILRYKKDLKKYPNRLILGSETFCKDAYQFMEIAKKEPRIIGDFVWAGMDYLGEVGIGAWVYEDYAPKDADKAGWMTAGSGRIDITGDFLGEAEYTKVALEKIKGPVIAVKPVYQQGKHSPSAWKMTDAMTSWSYRGCEGMKAHVEIYARAHRIEVYVNERKVADKVLKNTCIHTFKTPYESGIIKAISYDIHGKVIGEYQLETASEKTQLSLQPEATKVKQGGIVYVPISYTDEKGILKPMERHLLEVVVEGGELLGLGHACPFNLEGYTNTYTHTYYGKAMAIVRANDPQKVVIEVEDKASQLKAQTVIDVVSQ